MYEWIFKTVLVALLTYAAITDIKKREIPLAACAGCAILFISLHLLSGVAIWSVILTILGAAIIFLVMLLNTMFGGGGGDCILIATLTLAVGFRTALFVLAFSCVLMLFYHGVRVISQALRKTRCEGLKTAIPMAPFILLSTLMLIF